MPYKDPDKQRAAGRISHKKRWAANPEMHLAHQRKYRRKTGRASKCVFPNCQNYRNTYRYCNDHTLKNLIGDHRLYDRVRNQLRKSVGNAKILDVPREIFLVMLILNHSKHQILKMRGR